MYFLTVLSLGHIQYPNTTKHSYEKFMVCLDRSERKQSLLHKLGRCGETKNGLRSVKLLVEENRLMDGRVICHWMKQYILYPSRIHLFESSSGVDPWHQVIFK
ncbi:unnamed protein product [Lepeophtheirus salmonis]|uniref:(salmon louse) hypothetical protein n=1 Tax=Lepeophtheirus salmonis TaxID=72036 RepID=A0A7R8CFG4_LEPSM|nr:unnamed protein product [Lepeophtheirus salmonis]CAF2801786.1 unnamed protein product [Lepeophtheirus salmonis]